jgi:hypothetical protein
MVGMVEVIMEGIVVMVSMADVIMAAITGIAVMVTTMMLL